MSAREGESIGDYTCLKVSPSSVDLDKGLITVEGPITFEQNFDEVQEWAVTGGTGAYKTAHGELELDFSDEAGVRLTFRLIL